MTSLAISFYGQCCRRHFEGQQVVSNVSIVRSRWSICSQCSKFNNTNMLLRLLIAALKTSILLQNAMINLPTKFEVSNFIRSGNMKGVTKRKNGVVIGHPRSLKIASFDRAHTTSYSSLIEAILYRLWDIAFDRWTITLFRHPSCV